ncbi:MAG: TonB-dependent receptor, partial [Actinomycetia bacterium]|nr:TonB-dependent receptor [Actinomycetes bacterium]
AVGNDDLRLEKTSAWEVGYSGLIANRAFVTVDYYNSENKDFISDLVPQVGTSLGNCDPSDPIQDPVLCPINNDYGPWVSTDEAETTILTPPPLAPITVAQALRNAVDISVGGTAACLLDPPDPRFPCLGFRLAEDLDGSTVVVGRTYTNVGKVDTQGVDLGLQLFLSNAWGVQASYSWFDFDILDDNRDASDVLLPNSPEHKASVSVSFRKNKWATSVSARWVHGFRWSAGVFQGEVDDYGTEDISVTYNANDLITVSFNAANLRDNVHRQTFGGDLLQRRALMNVKFDW